MVLRHTGTRQQFVQWGVLIRCHCVPINLSFYRHDPAIHQRLPATLNDLSADRRNHAQVREDGEDVKLFPMSGDQTVLQ